MKTKLFELRDRATFVPVLAVKMVSQDEAEQYLLRRSGYGPDQSVLLTGLDGGLDKSTCDPFDWPNRTRHEAHKYIANNFDSLESGQVIDVEFILGETTQPKTSERAGEL
jgi:hypothetical protein